MSWRELNYQSADINKKLIINLRDLQHTMRQLYEGKGSQKRVLILLFEAGENITQRELTARLGIQPGSVSESIAKLENAGLVYCHTNEADKRTVDIFLTDTGKAEAENAIFQRRQRHIEMFSCLSSEEKDNLLTLLEKVNADWEERYSGKRDCDTPKEHYQHRHRREET